MEDEGHPGLFTWPARGRVVMGAFGAGLAGAVIPNLCILSVDIAESYYRQWQLDVERKRARTALQQTSRDSARHPQAVVDEALVAARTAKTEAISERTAHLCKCALGTIVTEAVGSGAGTLLLPGVGTWLGQAWGQVVLALL